MNQQNFSDAPYSLPRVERSPRPTGDGGPRLAAGLTLACGGLLVLVRLISLVRWFGGDGLYSWWMTVVAAGTLGVGAVAMQQRGALSRRVVPTAVGVGLALQPALNFPFWDGQAWAVANSAPVAVGVALALAAIGITAAIAWIQWSTAEAVQPSFSRSRSPLATASSVATVAFAIFRLMNSWNFYRDWGGGFDTMVGLLVTVSVLIALVLLVAGGQALSLFAAAIALVVAAMTVIIGFIDTGVGSLPGISMWGLVFAIVAAITVSAAAAFGLDSNINQEIGLALTTTASGGAVGVEPAIVSPPERVASVPGVAATQRRGPDVIAERFEVSAAASTPTVRHLRFSNGQTVPLGQAAIVGRDPESDELPFADKIAIDDRSVSKTHLAVSIDSAGVVRVKDLASMNGVELETQDGQRQLIAVNAWQTVGDGTVVWFGQSGFSIVRI